jgi:putative ABC transport system substrate-binding protein
MNIKSLLALAIFLGVNAAVADVAAQSKIYHVGYREMHRRAAVFVDKILKGAKPAELPVEQLTTYELVINLRAVKALGLALPASLLAQTDHVVE